MTDHKLGDTILNARNALHLCEAHLAEAYIFAEDSRTAATLKAIISLLITARDRMSTLQFDIAISALKSLDERVD